MNFLMQFSKFYENNSVKNCVRFHETCSVFSQLNHTIFLFKFNRKWCQSPGYSQVWGKSGLRSKSWIFSKTSLSPKPCFQPCSPTCGAGIQDATHLIWECPHTQTHRNDILDSIKCVAQKHGMLEGLIKDMAPSDMLKLSMGGKVTHFVPFHHRAISTLMQGSAPQWLAFYSFIETTGV